jgi:hypothetical protein
MLPIPPLFPVMVETMDTDAFRLDVVLFHLHPAGIFPSAAVVDPPAVYSASLRIRYFDGGGHSTTSPFNVCDCFEDLVDLLRDNGISEALKAVHSSGKPINHSTQVGFNNPPAMSVNGGA